MWSIHLLHCISLTFNCYFHSLIGHPGLESPIPDYHSFTFHPIFSLLCPGSLETNTLNIFYIVYPLPSCLVIATLKSRMNSLLPHPNQLFCPSKLMWLQGLNYVLIILWLLIINHVLKFNPFTYCRHSQRRSPFLILLIYNNNQPLNKDQKKITYPIIIVFYNNFSFN